MASQQEQGHTVCPLLVFPPVQGLVQDGLQGPSPPKPLCNFHLQACGLAVPEVPYPHWDLFQELCVPLKAPAAAQVWLGALPALQGAPVGLRGWGGTLRLCVPGLSPNSAVPCSSRLPGAPGKPVLPWGRIPCSHQHQVLVALLWVSPCLGPAAGGQKGRHLQVDAVTPVWGGGDTGTEGGSSSRDGQPGAAPDHAQLPRDGCRKVPGQGGLGAASGQWRHHRAGGVQGVALGGLHWGLVAPEWRFWVDFRAKALE